MSEWKHIASVEYQGTTAVVSGSAAAGTWLAAPAGLYRLRNGRWWLQQKQIPFFHINSVAVSEHLVLAAGLPHGIVRSATRGETWRMAWIEQTERPITCLTPSPHTVHDGVWLAGTDGDGILRSTDSGRHWELNNWGLQDFTVLDIVTAPSWGEREYAFAITAQGVYQSPNGGRAWRFVGEPFGDDLAQAVAVSPRFETDCTVWLVTESGRLFESTDRGRTWNALPTQPPSQLINDLFALPDGTLLAAGAGVWQSSDRGHSWQPTEHPHLERNQQVFKINRVDVALYATLLNGAAWRSDDDGKTWEPLTGLSSGRFLWIDAQTDELLIGGPLVGLWQLDDGVLRQIVDESEPVLAVARRGSDLLVSTPSGLFQNGAAKRGVERPFVRLLGVKERFWGVDEGGKLWQENADGWEVVALPAPVVALAANEDAVAVAMHDRRHKAVVVGVQRHDAPDEWHKMTELPTQDVRAVLTISSDGSVTVAAGRTVRTVDGSTRESDTAALADKTAPLVAMAYSDRLGTTAAASIEKVWLKQGGRAWRALPDAPSGEVFADLAFRQGEGEWRLLALTGDGHVWEIELQQP